MTTNRINPDSTVLNQLDDQWEKIAAMLVWKLAREGVTITFDDIENFSNESISGKAVLFTHGHKDSIEFSIVTADKAKELAKFDMEKSGGVQ